MLQNWKLSLNPRGKEMAEDKIKVHKVLKEYGDVKIFKAKGMEIPLYYLHTKELSMEERRIKDRIKGELAGEIIPDIGYSAASPEQKVMVIDEIRSRLSKFQGIPESRRELIKGEIIKETIGYSRLESLLSDDNLEEIMVSGSKLPVFVIHREYGTCNTNVKFSSDEEILSLIHSICVKIGKDVNFKNPLLDAQLSDKTRINIAIPPIALDGPSITIRKFMPEPLTIVDLMKSEMLSVELAAFLWICVDGLYIRPANILIGGGTASGKTTLLNSLLAFVPEGERVVIIEDTEELHPDHLNRVRFETRYIGALEKGGRGAGVDMDMLVRNALRTRPDRLILGEMRGSEAKTLFVAMNSGHEGCMGTLHANSTNELVIRLTHPPLDVPKPLLSGLNLIIMTQRVFSKKAGIQRRIVEVAEVHYRNEDIVMMDISRWNPESDSMNLVVQNSMIYKNLSKRISSMGFDINDIISKRIKILQELSIKGVSSRELHKIIKRHRIETLSFKPEELSH